MAPKKRGAEDEGVTADTTSSRVTRRSSARVNGITPAAESAAPPKKKKARTGSKEKEKGKESPSPEKPKKVVDGSKTIVIEHCKQCNQFKIRAIQVKNGLENGLSGVTVLVNPEKPRRGCFEIREEGGQTFISLLDMKRPFAPMRALEMDKVISDIIDKIN